MNSENKISKKMLFCTIVYVLFFPVLLLFISGDWFWIQGWIFGIWFLALSYGAVFYLYFKDPDLLLERFRKPGTGGEKGWDKYFVYAIIILFVVWFVIMPLDAERFKWTVNFPLWLEVIGIIALIVSAYFMLYSYIDNPYLSPLVRIQKDRGQKVVSNGVYGIIRHPMYLGGILLFIGTPMLLGSVYGIIIGVIVVPLLCGRILGEEKALSEELEGYTEYKNKVNYRLIPHIW